MEQNLEMANQVRFAKFTVHLSKQTPTRSRYSRAWSVQKHHCSEEKRVGSGDTLGEKQHVTAHQIVFSAGSIKDSIIRKKAQERTIFRKAQKNNQLGFEIRSLG